MHIINRSKSAFASVNVVTLLAIVIAAFGAMAWLEQASAWPQPVGPFAYVNGGDSLSVIDTGTNKVVAKIELGCLPANSQVSPDGKTVYAICQKSGSKENIAAIDTRTNAVAARVQVAGIPNSIVISPDGKSVYVAYKKNEYGPLQDNIAVIDAATNRVTGSILGRNVVAGQDGKRIYVGSADSLQVIDTATGKTVTTIPLGGAPDRLAVTPDQKRAVVVRNLGPYSDLVIVDLNLNVAAAAVDLSNFTQTYDLAINPDGQRVYVTGCVAGIDICEIGVIDLKINTLIAFVGLPRNVAQMTVTPDGKYVYVTGFYATAWGEAQGFISILDTRTNLITAGKAVPAVPGYAAATPDSKQIYVPLFPAFATDSSKMWVFNSSNNTVAATLVNLAGNVAIVPAPPGLPFTDYRMSHLEFTYGAKPNEDAFSFYSSTTLNNASNGIRPDLEGLRLDFGGFVATVASGKFKKQSDGSFVYNDRINGVLYNAYIKPAGVSSYVVHLLQSGLKLPPLANPVQVQQTIGDDSGVHAVQAIIRPPLMSVSR
ncbi:40-residue YVTN family beta-propeller repeat protein [Methylocella silvestris BL2]|uniref:40-residue YVTN family beta-propeller repeat protein n=1 Tax=Methylocella silvestris (strain DSM 15510 / CIP 108128 / LMG 27833 / NCIMB 13906 / BL2) TaxID=395965 RepID=B8ETN5_METSB|nr:YncE family protein [Methylocella silvestris]ACK52387.1 40-residue YVTN family beta-propeller repeat protein [Methylocella silvestris BL2]